MKFSEIALLLLKIVAAEASIGIGAKLLYMMIRMEQINYALWPFIVVDVISLVAAGLFLLVPNLIQLAKMLLGINFKVEAPPPQPKPVE